MQRGWKEKKERKKNYRNPFTRIRTSGVNIVRARAASPHAWYGKCIRELELSHGVRAGWLALSMVDDDGTVAGVAPSTDGPLISLKTHEDSGGLWGAGFVALENHHRRVLHGTYVCLYLHGGQPPYASPHKTHTGALFSLRARQAACGHLGWIPVSCLKQGTKAR